MLMKGTGSLLMCGTRKVRLLRKAHDFHVSFLKFLQHSCKTLAGLHSAGDIEIGICMKLAGSGTVPVLL